MQDEFRSVFVIHEFGHSADPWDQVENLFAPDADYSGSLRDRIPHAADEDRSRGVGRQDVLWSHACHVQSPVAQIAGMLSRLK
ncbi:hypothetical protein GCM10007175_12680 [Pseudarthrobacter scleromae]|uniref:Uncharacterized protein n=1 Tax=Pseudarthrobacter scleromae TaxID=158897 RepID=A0ABQ2CC85_9MICC|nr:hypothetical protein GCM10007175_12680 [Pseudarthrobacter scleromae]